MVVQRALQEFQTSYVLEHAMPEWTGRGLPVFNGGQHMSSCGVYAHFIHYVTVPLFLGERCLRASPQESATNGFFIAVFLRKDEDTTVTKYRSDTLSTQQHTMVHTYEHMIPKKGSKKGWRRKQKLPVTK